MAMICKHCGTVQRERTMPGSGWIEAVLWLCYIIPGLIYSIWRRGSRSRACSACGGRDLVPSESPVGQQLAQQYHPGGLPAPVAAPGAKRTPTNVHPALVVLVVLGAVWLFFARHT